MLQFSSPQDLQNYSRQCRQRDVSVGFVPTMGALHQGHLSLIQQAREESEVVIVSIFVNPAQFNNPEDFKKYPNTLAADLALLQKESVDVAFLPNTATMYADQQRYSVHENTHHLDLCGKTRPGHFDGVLTIVLKLLHIVQPHKVFMGEKDYQQLQLVSDMVSAFFIPTEVVPCPTVRDSHGLALSSRNSRLSQAGIQKARFFAQTLKSQKTLEEIQKSLEAQEIQIDYLEDKNKRRFAAVFIENVRLIDNVLL